MLDRALYFVANWLPQSVTVVWGHECLARGVYRWTILRQVGVMAPSRSTENNHLGLHESHNEKKKKEFNQFSSVKLNDSLYSDFR